MAIDFTTLFTQIGKLGKFQLAVNTQQALWDDKIAEIAAEYAAAVDQDAIADLITADTLKTGRSGIATLFSKLKTAAENTVIEMVKADKPAKATSVAAAIEELRRQMVVSSESVTGASVASSATVLPTNSGTGAIVTTVKRGDGLTQELVVAETGFLTCTTDSQTGGATERQETFTYAGEADDGDPSSFDWPTGSAGSATITVVDPTADNDGSNILTNSDFEDWTGSPLAATGWGTSPVVGVWGTDIARAAVPLYSDGTYGLSFNGDGSTLSSIQQKFDDSSVGTAGALLPQRTYVVGFWGKVLSSAPAAGVLTVSLVDGNGTVIADDQSTNNTQTFAITGWTTSYVFKSATFRTPKLLPTTAYLRLTISTAITNAKTAYINGLAMALTTPLYDGGPSVAIFPGATKWVAGDGWTVANTNDRGGASNLASFNALFDRFFGMRANLQQLPISGSPTQADTLISS